MAQAETRNRNTRRAAGRTVLRKARTWARSTLTALLVLALFAACDLDVKVTPNTGLVDGQIVSIQASGLPPDSTVSLLQCQTGYSLRLWDDFRDHCGYPTDARTDRRGNLQTELPVATSVWRWRNRSAFACHTGGCMIVLTEGSVYDGSPVDAGELHVVPIEFAPLPAPTPFIRVDPASALVGYWMTVTGSGFWPNTYLTLGQCRASPSLLARDCVLLTDVLPGVKTDQSGSFRTTQLFSDVVTPSQGESFDCHTPNTCVVIAAPSRSASVNLVESAAAPIQAGRPQRGTLQVQTPFYSDDKLHLEGADWAANATLNVRYCSPEPTFLGPTCPVATSVTTDAGGAFAVDLDVPSFLRIDYGASGYGTELRVNCTTAAGACYVHTSDPRAVSDTALDLPISVLRSPGRTAVMDLQGPLVDGGSVRFYGSGWQPREQLTAWICGGGGAGTARALAWCNLRGSVWTDNAGSFTGNFSVPATFSFFPFVSSERDCRSMPCEWLFSSSEDLAYARHVSNSIPLTFSDPLPLSISGGSAYDYGAHTPGSSTSKTFVVMNFPALR